ncbi:MAG TPA: DUF3016 domain-containing protein [Terriglobales bacterium]|nr:DUF3016 domain-containing protein [Terriglobales bacterium]
MPGLSKTIPIVGFLLLSGCSANAPIDPSRSRISVTFVEPEKFTDARRAELEPTQSGVLGELQNFIVTTGTRYVPENMKLRIRITNVDLAGDFELFRGPQADQVRITKGLYPPHIVLEFEVVDSTEKVIKSGKRDLTDIDYQSRSVYPREDYLRYEKDILRDWLRAEFSDLNSTQVDRGALA